VRRRVTFRRGKRKQRLKRQCPPERRDREGNNQWKIQKIQKSEWIVKTSILRLFWAKRRNRFRHDKHTRFYKTVIPKILVFRLAPSCTVKQACAAQPRRFAAVGLARLPKKKHISVSGSKFGFLANTLRQTQKWFYKQAGSSNVDLSSTKGLDVIRFRLLRPETCW
jgi:hypothetical protein